MTVTNLIRNLQSVKYLRGGRDWDGGDCWFIVEAWYKERFNITLECRGDIEPGPDGFLQGYENTSEWVNVDTPANDDLVIMSTVVDRQKIMSAHCGIFWNGGVIHSEDKVGCVYQLAKSRLISRRITGYCRYKHFM